MNFVRASLAGRHRDAPPGPRPIWPKSVQRHPACNDHKYTAPHKLRNSARLEIFSRGDDLAASGLSLGSRTNGRRQLVADSRDLDDSFPGGFLASAIVEVRVRLRDDRA